MAIYDPENNDQITVKNEILATTLKYNVGVLTKNNVQPMDLQGAIEEKK